MRRLLVLDMMQDLAAVRKTHSSTVEACFFSLSMCASTHQVCAVGKVLCVGAAMIWNEGQRVLKPPWGSWEEPVVNCRRRASSSCVKLDTTAQNHFITWGKEKGKANKIRHFHQLLGKKDKKDKKSVRDVPSLGSAMIHQQSQRGPWSPVRLCHQCHTSAARSTKIHKYPVLIKMSAGLNYNTSHIPPTRSHQIWLAGFLEPVHSNLQLIRKNAPIMCTLPEISNERNWQEKYKCKNAAVC